MGAMDGGVSAPLVFVSYSHDDRDICQQLEMMLRPVRR
jgi:hypothetical protein